MQSAPSLNAPWCVGSVFSPPQLRTSDLGPLVFSAEGKPQCLVSTGHRLEQIETPISICKQTESFFLGSASPFIPRDLLEDYIKTDVSFNEACHTHSSRYCSNRVQGLKCIDGSVILFFICGEDADQVGSTVFYPGSSGRWFSAQTSLSYQHFGDSKQSGWSVSPSLRQSIHQLSAVLEHSPGNGGQRDAIVAARTIYHVYFCTVSREEDRVQFISTSVSKFEVPVAHVTWNIHVYGEAAVILESGVMCLFHIQATSSGNPKRVLDLKAKVTLESPIQRLLAKYTNPQQVHNHDEARTGKDQQSADNNAPKLQEFETKWWRCEFGWLPQTLLVANSQEIFLVDVRQGRELQNATSGWSRRLTVDGHISVSGIDVVATAGASNFSQLCSLKPRKENILAFARADYGGMYEFTVATEQHVMLFDIRQPQTPILEWEHGMRQEPPGLLIMCPLSRLRSFSNEEKVKNIHNGRVILAASFMSGDMRVFCYGSEVRITTQPMSSNRKKLKVEGHDWNNATYAWENPSRLYAPRADVDDWREVLSSPEELLSGKVRNLFVPKSQGLHNIAGVVLLPHNYLEPTSNKRNQKFSILQLTGLGEILAQTYQASDELQYPFKANILNMADIFDDEQSVGVQVQGHQFQEPKCEVLPTFLKYIHTGSILATTSAKNFEKREESRTFDCIDGALNPGQDATCLEDIPVLGQQSTQVSPLLHVKLEHNECGKDHETLLKTFIQDLNVPLSMYEVAQKVLGMGLPEKLAPLVAGMPSDLDAPRHRGYKFPLVSPLLRSPTPTHKPADPGREGESMDHTSVLTSKTGLQGKVPLALLLEMHNLEKPDLDPSSSKRGRSETCPHGNGTNICAQGPMDVEDPLYNYVTFEDGQTQLLEVCKNLGGFIEELVSNTEPNVVSLSQSTEDWPGNLNGGGDLDSNILLYELRAKGGIPREADYTQSLIAGNGMDDLINVVKSTQEVDMDGMNKKSSTFLVEDMYSKFIAGKFGYKHQEETHPIQRCLKIDPNLCRVELNLTDRDEEELDEGELKALENMQTDFLQWQQSFAQYRNS